MNDYAHMEKLGMAMEPDDLIARLRKLDCCAVSDALDSCGLPPAITGINRLSTDRRIAGRAITVELAEGPSREGPVRHLCTAAVEAGGPDTVLVISQRSGIDAAGWGGVLSHAAQTAGIEGVIVEGPARDIDEAIELEFPVYARCATARTARGRIHERGYNTDIMVGDLVVRPGDLVLADSSGVVVIAIGQAKEVLEAAERIVSKEAKMSAAVRSGEPVSKVMGAAYEHMLEKGDD